MGVCVCVSGHGCVCVSGHVCVCVCVWSCMCVCYIEVDMTSVAAGEVMQSHGRLKTAWHQRSDTVRWRLLGSSPHAKGTAALIAVPDVLSTDLWPFCSFGGKKVIYLFPVSDARHEKMRNLQTS